MSKCTPLDLQSSKSLTHPKIFLKNLSINRRRRFLVGSPFCPKLPCQETETNIARWVQQLWIRLNITTHLSSVFLDIKPSHNTCQVKLLFSCLLGLCLSLDLGKAVNTAGELKQGWLCCRVQGKRYSSHKLLSAMLPEYKISGIHSGKEHCSNCTKPHTQLEFEGFNCFISVCIDKSILVWSSSGEWLK